MLSLPEGDDPVDAFHFPLLFTWTLPPLPKGPDLLVLATELAGIGGTDLAARGVGHRLVRRGHRRARAQPQRSWRASRSRSTAIFKNEEQLCDVLDRCLAVSEFLVDACACVARRNRFLSSDATSALA